MLSDLKIRSGNVAIGSLQPIPGRSDEPITARTNLYKCLCLQEFDKSHLPDQVQDQVARLATLSQGVRQIAGPLTEGPGPASRPGSLPAPRVACRCSPVGFDRQHILARPVGHSSSTSSSAFASLFIDFIIGVCIFFIDFVIGVCIFFIDFVIGVYIIFIDFVIFIDSISSGRQDVKGRSNHL
jgi:hypothetical protein